MRVVAAVAGLAAFAIAQTAAAAPVTLAPVSYSDEYQTRVDEEIGAYDDDALQRLLTRALSRALERQGGEVTSGGAPVSIEVTLIDARPNRPTRAQLSRQPSLDMSRSVSTGGAELSATIRAADGRVLDQVTDRYYTYSLLDLHGPPHLWTDAHRAIRRFSRKVADAYAANAN